MKLMISLMGVLLLAGCQPKPNVEKELTTDFEGSITYRLVEWDPKKTDSAKAARMRIYHPKDTMMVLFNEGSFLAVMDSSAIDYSYFNPHLNKEYTKLSGEDSLYADAGDENLSPEFVLLDVLQEYNTDTILGYVCNRLTMKYKNYTTTYLYSPEIATNPEWYKKTKLTHYDVVYKLMKAYYLSMRMEFKDHAFTYRAIRVNRVEVPDDVFPDARRFRLYKSR